jgi:hypothetical protein
MACGFGLAILSCTSFPATAQPTGSLPAIAQGGPRVRLPEETWIYERQLSAMVPAGLFPLTLDGIKENYTGKSIPQHVFKNGEGSVSIAFNFMQKNVGPLEILPFQAELREQLKKKIPGIQWLSDSKASIKGREWALLKFKSPSEGFLITNWIMISSWKGRLIEIVVSSMDDIEGVNDVQINDFYQSLNLKG